MGREEGDRPAWVGARMRSRLNLTLMAINAGGFGHEAGLTDRLAERAVLDRILTAARAGQSSVLVVRGEPGIGKTELVEYLAGRATACRVVRVGGGAVGDGISVCWAPSTVLADTGASRRVARAAASRTQSSARDRRSHSAGPVSGRAGRAGAPGRGSRRAARGLPGR